MYISGKTAGADQYVLGKENKNNERIIAQLAYEMNKRDHVLVIATTRNIKEISSSLKRPKHFEMFVSMFLPDFDNRMQIIEYCCNKKRVDPCLLYTSDAADD